MIDNVVIRGIIDKNKKDCWVNLRHLTPNSVLIFAFGGGIPIEGVHVDLCELKTAIGDLYNDPAKD